MSKYLTHLDEDYTFTYKNAQQPLFSVLLFVDLEYQAMKGICNMTWLFHYASTAYSSFRLV